MVALSGCVLLVRENYHQPNASGAVAFREKRAERTHFWRTGPPDRILFNIPHLGIEIGALRSDDTDILGGVVLPVVPLFLLLPLEALLPNLHPEELVLRVRARSSLGEARLYMDRIRVQTPEGSLVAPVPRIERPFNCSALDVPVAIPEGTWTTLNACFPLPHRALSSFHVFLEGLAGPEVALPEVHFTETHGWALDGVKPL